MERALKIGGRLALFGAGLGLAYWQLQGRFNPEARYRVERKDGAFEIRIYAPAVRAETAIVATDWNEALETGFERLAYYIHEGNSDHERIAMTGPVTQTAERVAVATPLMHQQHSTPNGKLPNGAIANGRTERASFASAALEPGPLPNGGVSGAAQGEDEPPATAPLAMEHALERIEHIPSVPSWILSFAMPPGRHLRTLPVPDDPRVRLRAMPERRVAVLRFRGRHTPLLVGDRARELLHRLHREGLEPHGPVEFAGYDPKTTLPFLCRNEVRVDLAA